MNRKHQQLIGMSLLLVLLLSIGVVFIYPAMTKIFEINQQITAEKKELEKRMNLGLNIRNIQADLQIVETEMPKIEKIFLNQGQELELLNLLEGLAEKNKLEFSAKPDFTGKKINENIYKHQLSMTFNGDWKNINALINEIENLEFYLIADNFSLVNNKNDQLLANWNGAFYTLKQ
jgi:hypothetical protein